MIDRRDRRWVQLAAKRLLDVVASTLGLVVLAPIYLAITVAILVTMGRPILFTQVRPGLRGEPFRIYKFRTMTGAPGSHPEGDGQRITRVGRFLRFTSLDELPELWNVLTGDMSLVGPRPLLMDYLDLYTPEQARRHEMRPGLTGLAQVEGRNALPWPQRLALDVKYVDEWSLWLDLKILVRTVVAVIRLRGITQPGHPTVERFRGTENPVDR
jgi:sugar transferase EpsL